MTPVSDILICLGDSQMEKRLARELQSWGYTCQTTNDNLDEIIAWSAEHPNALLLVNPYVHRDELFCFEVLQARQHRGPIRLIVLCPTPSSGRQHELFSLNPLAILHLPCRMADLYAAVRLAERQPVVG